MTSSCWALLAGAAPIGCSEQAENPATQSMPVWHVSVEPSTREFRAMASSAAFQYVGTTVVGSGVLPNSETSELCQLALAEACLSVLAEQIGVRPDKGPFNAPWSAGAASVPSDCLRGTGKLPAGHLAELLVSEGVACQLDGVTHDPPERKRGATAYGPCSLCNRVDARLTADGNVILAGTLSVAGLLVSGVATHIGEVDQSSFWVGAALAPLCSSERPGGQEGLDERLSLWWSMARLRGRVGVALREGTVLPDLPPDLSDQQIASYWGSYKTVANGLGWNCGGTP